MAPLTTLGHRTPRGRCPFHLAHPGTWRTGGGRSSNALDLCSDGHPRRDQRGSCGFQPSVEEERAPRGESTDRQHQCGRYTQQAGGILRSPPRVLMMQASDHGHLDDSTLVGALHRSRLRCVLLQGKVSPATVVVGEVVSQQATQVRFVQDHDVVEALAAQGPNEASTYGFCQGDRAAVLTSWIPMDCARLENATP
jgi:hypothetical protein